MQTLANPAVIKTTASVAVHPPIWGTKDDIAKYKQSCDSAVNEDDWIAHPEDYATCILDWLKQVQASDYNYEQCMLWFADKMERFIAQTDDQTSTFSGHDAQVLSLPVARRCATMIPGWRLGALIDSRRSCPMVRCELSCVE